MTSEIPPDVVMETVYVIEGRYAPDAAERRRPVRPEHLTRIARLRDEGVMLEAGGFADMSSSMLILRVASKEAALDVARADVYVREGVWEEVVCRPFIRAIRPSESRGG